MVWRVREAASESHVACRHWRFLSLGVSVAEKAHTFKSTFISCLGNIYELFMSICNVHGKLGGGVCYLPACTSLYWQTIYIQMDIGHLPAVATALPWLFKQYCIKQRKGIEL